MSGFSGEWLSLREPVDHRSLNPDVLAAFARHFGDKEAISIVDLGSGSGSSLRALAPRLGLRQKWQLVDHDRQLLSFALEQLALWADSAKDENNFMLLQKDGRQIEVKTQLADLSDGLPDALSEKADCLTSSAFFDLVSPQWIENFCASLAGVQLPLLALLTYDGTEVWSPPHFADEVMLKAFHQDQHKDKGFGPAAGPQSATVLHEALSIQHYKVFSGQSDWLLNSNTDTELIRALATGSANALAGSNVIKEAELHSWRDSRQAADRCTIGHKDIFGIPQTNSS